MEQSGHATKSNDVTITGGDSSELRAPNPWIALLGSLALPPVGHVYSGAARRGIVIAVLGLVARALALFSILAVPGRPSLLFYAAVVIATYAWTGLDAFAIAKAQRLSFTPRSYQRGRTYAVTALVAIVAGMLLASGMRNFLQAFRQPSPSMRPTLEVGDYFFIDKAGYAGREPARGDIVAYRWPQDPSKEFVKRVIGLPGDSIEVRAKRVFIDGAAIDEPYAIHTDGEMRPGGLDPRDNFGPYEVPASMYFVLGDDRDNSNDSRYSGPVQRRAIRGRAFLVYWSWDPARSAVRWDRIGLRPR